MPMARICSSRSAPSEAPSGIAVNTTGMEADSAEPFIRASSRSSDMPETCPWRRLVQVSS